MKKPWKCRIIVIEPSGQSRKPVIANIGDHVSIFLENLDIDIEITPTGLVEYQGIPFSKNVPLKLNGYTIKPEAFIEPPAPRKKTGKVCRYCQHWDAKAGKKSYLEVVRLESGAQCELTQAITDQVARDYKLPPIDPDDVGMCAIEDELNSGNTPSCEHYKKVSYIIHLRRMQKHLFQIGKFGGQDA